MRHRRGATIQSRVAVCEGQPCALERLVPVSAGHPSRASRKGETLAPESLREGDKGEGKASPACEPGRVSAEARKRKDTGLPPVSERLHRRNAIFVMAVGAWGWSCAPAHAMHISEGILPAPWAILWLVLSIPFLFWGLRELRNRSRETAHIKPMVGLVGAAVFVISCMPIPVPTAGTCSHPCGTGMAAILVGPGMTVVLASVALTLQALFLAHGGLTTLGANILSMGVMGAFAGYGVFILARRLRASWFVAAFLAGMASDWAVYAGTSVFLASALHGDGPMTTMLLAILLAFAPTQLVLGILEGFMSAGAYRFIRLRRPEFLEMLAKGDST